MPSLPDMLNTSEDNEMNRQVNETCLYILFQNKISQFGIMATHVDNTSAVYADTHNDDAASPHVA